MGLSSKGSMADLIKEWILEVCCGRRSEGAAVFQNIN
jgi:hypothetical protein